MRSRKPDPLAAHIVHVREDRRDAAGFAGRFRSPGGRVKMFDQNLIHALVGGKNPHRGSPELSLHFALMRRHVSCSSTYSTSGPSATPKLLWTVNHSPPDSSGQA
jgi:hypothetical protein